MTKYGQFCPVVRAVEILGERWTLLIVRDLLHDVNHFNELSRGLPKLSRGLLAKRLRQLEAAGVLERIVDDGGHQTEYRLTEAGEALLPVVESLMVWGANWALEQPMPDELDPILLMWWLRRRVCRDALPPERVVVQFDFRGDERSYWLVLERQDVSVCFDPPDFDVDVWVEADLAVFYRVWLGKVPFAGAVEEGGIEVSALPALERAFPGWFAWSPAAEAVRAVNRVATQPSTHLSFRMVP